MLDSLITILSLSATFETYVTIINMVMFSSIAYFFTTRKNKDIKGRLSHVASILCIVGINLATRPLLSGEVVPIYSAIYLLFSLVILLRSITRTWFVNLTIENQLLVKEKAITANNRFVVTLVSYLFIINIIHLLA